MYVIFKSDHYHYAYFISAIYPLDVAAYTGTCICHSTCPEMPRIAQLCTYFWKFYMGEEDPYPPSNALY